MSLAYIIEHPRFTRTFANSTPELVPFSVKKDKSRRKLEIQLPGQGAIFVSRVYTHNSTVIAHILLEPIDHGLQTKTSCSVIGIKLYQGGFARCNL